MTRVFLVARYDVTGLDEAEVDGLAGEVTAQAEASEFHPDVPVETNIVEEPEA